MLLFSVDSLSLLSAKEASGNKIKFGEHPNEKIFFVVVGQSLEFEQKVLLLFKFKLLAIVECNYEMSQSFFAFIQIWRSPGKQNDPIMAHWNEKIHFQIETAAAAAGLEASSSN